MYQSLAGADGEPERAVLLRKLDEYEEGHAARWGALLGKLNRPVPREAPFVEQRILVRLARIFAVGSVLAFLHKGEVDGIAKYRDQADRWKDPDALAVFRDIMPDERARLRSRDRGRALPGWCSARPVYPQRVPEERIRGGPGRYGRGCGDVPRRACCGRRRGPARGSADGSKELPCCAGGGAHAGRPQPRTWHGGRGPSVVQGGGNLRQVAREPENLASAITRGRRARTGA